MSPHRQSQNGNNKDDKDDTMDKVIVAMEDVRIPDVDARPFDHVRAAGPPASPPDFPRPIFQRGRRDDVLAYCERTQTHIEARNVLFRDYSRDCGGSPERALSRVRQAYWPIPHKKKIKTIMGHVEICHVLTRSVDENDNCSLNDDSDDSSCDEMEDEDVVFILTTQRVAVKVNYGRRMDRYRGNHAEDPLKEVSAMQLIGNDNPHVMGIKESLVVGVDLNVVMPYAASGDMFELLQVAQERGRGFPEGESRYWFRQLIDGIRYLHQKGICHRDLSPENVMMDLDNSLIIDMGMAIRIPYTDPNNKNISIVTDILHGTEKRLIKSQGICGKLPYMSPEIYENRSAFDGGAVDIWTAGTILFCMVTGNRSYSRPHNSDAQFYWMHKGLSRLLADWDIDLSRECVDLLKNMLQVDPRLRYSLEEVLNHPWFAHEDTTPTTVA